jgi:hypothetical protein
MCQTFKSHLHFLEETRKTFEDFQHKAKEKVRSIDFRVQIHGKQQENEKWLMMATMHPTVMELFPQKTNFRSKLSTSLRMG